MAVTASHIGLAAKDAILLKSLMGMLQGSEHLSANIDFVDFNSYVQSKKIPDILFINLDLPRAVSLWEDIKNSFPLTTGIFVTSNNAYDINNLDYYILRRPLPLRQVVTILQKIVNIVEPEAEPEPEPEIAEEIIEQLNVLVVDDSLPVRKYMQHILPKLVSENLLIEYASNGQEAIHKTTNSVYDLVFLDVVMPGVDGYKVCKYIKKQQESYVVMLTGKKTSFDKVRGTMSGCDTYMVKPPKEQILQKIVESCLLNSKLAQKQIVEQVSYRY